MVIRKESNSSWLCSGFRLIAELICLVVKTGFPTERMRQTVNFIREYYGTLPITCNDYPKLIEFMHHDKKNRGNEINVTLLGGNW